MTSLSAHLVATAAGALLLTAVLILWRRSITGAVALLAIQGFALAGLAFATAPDGHVGHYVLAFLIAVLKGMIIPALISRTALSVRASQEVRGMINPTTGMLFGVALAAVAFLVARPLTTDSTRPTAAAIPVGLAVVLIGFLVLMSRRHALSQIIGFVLVDNGIGAITIVSTGGLPVVIEIGVLLDVLLVVLVLLALTRRIRTRITSIDVYELGELKD